MTRRDAVQFVGDHVDDDNLDEARMSTSTPCWRN